MAKISIKGLVPGKRYRMVIEPKFSDETTTDGNASVVFTVPKAPPLAKKTRLKIDKTTYNAKVGGKTVKRPKLLISIPEDIIDNLIWNDSVRDIVYVVYRRGDDKSKANIATRRYLNGEPFVIGTVPDIPAWTSGQVRTFGIKVADTNYYSFQFVIARYIKDSSGSWTTKFWLQGNKLNDILSQQSVWGS